MLDQIKSLTQEERQLAHAATGDDAHHRTMYRAAAGRFPLRACDDSANTVYVAGSVP